MMFVLLCSCNMGSSYSFGLQAVDRHKRGPTGVPGRPGECDHLNWPLAPATCHLPPATSSVLPGGVVVRSARAPTWSGARSLTGNSLLVTDSVIVGDGGALGRCPYLPVVPDDGVGRG